VLAQQIFIQHILHSIFNKANQIFLGIQSSENYKGVVILLDEAWRFFQQPEVLDELERISRMGRSLKVGLWLADQSIPTGVREWHVLSNMHTRFLGSITADKSLVQRVMPLSDSMLSALPNLRRGMAIFFNQEYSRIPTPIMIPPCTCYHEGD
jgi:DNA helicase HerA-like ATPase